MTKHNITSDSTLQLRFSSLAARALSTSPEPIKTPTKEDVARIMRMISNALEVDMNIAADENELSRRNRQIKESSLRNIIEKRIFMMLQCKYNSPIAELVKEKGEEEAKKHIEKNSIYRRATNHPTEGQNLATIQRKKYIEELWDIYANILINDQITILDYIYLQRVARRAGYELPEFSTMPPNRDEFKTAARAIHQHVVDELFANDIHITEKVTMSQEVDLTIHNLISWKRSAARICSRYPNIVHMENMEFSTWSGDRDGKPHVNPIHALKFELLLQKKFISKIMEYLNELQIMFDHHDLDASNITALQNYLSKQMSKYASETPAILTHAEGKKFETIIVKQFEKIKNSKDIPKNIAEYVTQAQNFTTNSHGKIIKNSFTTREEADISNEAMYEITDILYRDSIVFRTYLNSAGIYITSSTKDLDNKTKEAIATYICQNANSPDIINALKENAYLLSTETKRQLSWAMTSMRLHGDHEHIISQFDCKTSTYATTHASYEIARALAPHHNDLDFITEEFEKIQKETGMDFSNNFFSEEGLEAIKKAQIIVAILPEEEHTIKQTPNFTREILQNKHFLELIKSQGIIRQVRSNSDGSAAMGAGVLIANNKADIEIRKIIKELGLEGIVMLKVLAGIGNNDAHRMGGHSLLDLVAEMTRQGGDMTNENRYTMEHSLAMNDNNLNQTMLEELYEKHGEEVITKFMELLIAAHKKSEEAISIDGTSSNNLIHRGIIQEKVLEETGKSSSRPESRGTTDTERDELLPNTASNSAKIVDKKAMRRIGAVNLQMTSANQTFLTAGFLQDNLADFSQEFREDLFKIPMFKNWAFSGLMALATNDDEVFLLCNGNQKTPSQKDIETGAAKFEYLYNKQQNLTAEEFDTLLEEENISRAKLREIHTYWQISHNVDILKNTLNPLLLEATESTKAQISEIVAAFESKEISANEAVVQACDIASLDSSIEPSLAMQFAVVKNQMENVRPNLLLRNEDTKAANEASFDGQTETFNECCRRIAIALRASGNNIMGVGQEYELNYEYQKAIDATKAISWKHDFIRDTVTNTAITKEIHNVFGDSSTKKPIVPPSHNRGYATFANDMPKQAATPPKLPEFRPPTARATTVLEAAAKRVPKSPGTFVAGVLAGGAAIYAASHTRE